MTRDDLRGIIEGISDEQLKAILDIHSKDIGKVKGNLDEVKAELEAANAKIGEYETEIKGLKDSLEDSEAVKAVEQFNCGITCDQYEIIYKTTIRN